jgi:hypothetical protein
MTDFTSPPKTINPNLRDQRCGINNKNGKDNKELSLKTLSKSLVNGPILPISKETFSNQTESHLRKSLSKTLPQLDK